MLEREFPTALNPSDLHAPHIYSVMAKFTPNELPKPPNITRNSQSGKLNVEYAKRKPVPAIVNTRNPFARLYASWSDKFGYNSAFWDGHHKPKERLKWIFDAVEDLEEDDFIIPPGYSNSFEAFIKYVSISSTQTQNHHWRSLFWLCVGFL